MATLICNGTGNLTGATTFAAAETGALALNLIRNQTGNATVAAGIVTSASFTVTTGHVIDGVLLWVKQTSAGSTGTFKVDLQKGAVSQATVTVNKTDLPDVTSVVYGPTLFKLGSTAIGDGAANWTIVLTTTGTQTVTYTVNASGVSNFTRALRTTTAATPAAGDDLYVTGELSGAGTHTSYTVTMDSIATTVYGNGTLNSTTVSGGMIAVANYGTLSYGTSASTNYYLRIAGDLRVYQFGTLNIGASGAEIPRNATAVLEFQPISTAGDFGLFAYDNAILNCAGLSRTSGKNVVKCKLTADLVGANVLTTGSNTGLTSNSFTRDLDATGTSYLAGSVQENTALSIHGPWFSGGTVTNATQTAVVWLAQGTGAANNRYVRITVGNNAPQTSVTNGFFSDIDLQAGTAGTVTVVGNGTATSVSIAASGTGWLVKITGKVSSGIANPAVLLNACSAAGTLSYTGASNWNFIYDHVALVTAASISDSTLNVDIDTGWLSGDVVCVASTSRLASDCDVFTLNANAGASSFTSALYPTGIVSTPGAVTHSGTAPTQGEIGLITRNVHIRSTSSINTSFVYAAALATMTISWTDLSFLGVNGTNKHGLEIDPSSSGTANPKIITYCTFRDGPNYGSLWITNNGNVSANTTWSNNIVWNIAYAAAIVSTLSSTDWTMDNNLVIKTLVYGFLINDAGGTLTNNTVAGGAFLPGFWLGESSTAVVGNWSGNTVHSSNVGVTINALAGTINNLTVWRTGSSAGGIPIQANSPDLVFANLTAFGNSFYSVGNSVMDLTINGGSLSGDTSFSTTYGIGIASGHLALNNVDFSGTGTALAPSTTSDFQIATAGTYFIVNMNNCKVGAAGLTKTNWSDQSYISYEKYNQTAGDHRCEMRYGGVRTDSVIYNIAAPSMRMTPSSTSFKMASAPKGRGIIAAVANGSTTTASVYVRKSVVGDGTAYNGNQPRLIQRANAALGQIADVVLATASAAAGSWELLSGTTSAITDDGAWEFIIDCDGTSGWVNVDDWAFT